MSDVNRLSELGMVPELAKEIKRQISNASVAPTWADITGKPSTFPPVTATDTVIGGVLMGAAVTNAADETEVVAQFNGLLSSLRASGAIAS